MQHSTTNSKFVGLLGIIFGLAAFSPFVFGDKSRLIIQGSDLFFVKYSLFILFINGGLGFLISGIMIYLGLIPPNYFGDIDKYQKAKYRIIGILFFSPIVLSFTFVIFVLKTKTWLKLGWPLLIIYALFSLFSSIRTLRNKETIDKAS